MSKSKASSSSEFVLRRATLISLPAVVSRDDHRQSADTRACAVASSYPHPSPPIQEAEREPATCQQRAKLCEIAKSMRKSALLPNLYIIIHSVANWTSSMATTAQLFEVKWLLLLEAVLAVRLARELTIINVSITVFIHFESVLGNKYRSTETFFSWLRETLE